MQRSQESGGGKARGRHKALPTGTGVYFLLSVDGATVVGALYQELFPTELHHQLPREYFV